MSKFLFINTVEYGINIVKEQVEKDIIDSAISCQILHGILINPLLQLQILEDSITLFHIFYYQDSNYIYLVVI